MKNIPKTMYFYWGGDVLPWLRYMTIYSARKFHPSWKIVLNMPKEMSKNHNWPGSENKNSLTGIDYLSQAKKLVDEVRIIDMMEFGLTNDLPEITKSDYLRLYLLSYEHGVWLDIDQLFFRPLEYSFLQADYLTYICYQRDVPEKDPYHSIGLLMGGQNNMTWRNLLQHAKKHIQDYDYQAIGSPFYAKYMNVTASEVFSFSNDIVYPIRWPDKIWNYSAERSLEVLKPETIGIHWYAGHKTSAKYQAKLTPDNYDQYDNIICYFLKHVLAK